MSNMNKLNALQSEKMVTADESQTKMRRLKRKFIENARKSPELRNVDPEALWKALDKTEIYKHIMRLPYQKVKK